MISCSYDGSIIYLVFTKSKIDKNFSAASALFEKLEKLWFAGQGVIEVGGEINDIEKSAIIFDRQLDLE